MLLQMVYVFPVYLLLSLFGVNGAPHTSSHEAKHSSRVRRLEASQQKQLGVILAEKEPEDSLQSTLQALEIVAISPASTVPKAVEDQAIPVLVAPPSFHSSSKNHIFNSNLREGEFRVLFAPPSMQQVLGNAYNHMSPSPSCSSASTSHSTTSTTTAASTPSSSVISVSDKPMMMAYYPDWAGSTMPPEKVDFDRFDWVDFAFAVPDANFDLKFTQDDSEDLLRRLIASAHAKNKGVKLSVGGWTGSKHFSTAVSTDENRKVFAQNFVDIYHKFGLDGVDIDWEYPGIAGASGNIISPADTNNYLKFLKVLREALPQGAIITAATQVWPFADTDGTPLTDVGEFAKLFDWILMMNYDVWGSSNTPGPNAPLEDGCKNSTQPLANAVAAVKSWTAAGMPLEKLTLGVPSYGYISQSNVQQLSGRAETILVKNDDGGSNNGQVQFNGLIAQGALAKNDGAYVGAGGFQRRWDSCSGTPFLRSESQGQIITYDDPHSLKLKGEFAKIAGIKGVNIFDAHGDTESWELVDAVRNGLGLT